MKKTTSEWIDNRIIECQSTLDQLAAESASNKRTLRYWGISQELNTLRRIKRMEGTTP